MSDILVRLRTPYEWYGEDVGSLWREAADEIESLLMEVEIYENALRKITECPHPIPRADGMVDMDWNPARMVQIAEEALKWSDQVSQQEP